MVQRRTKQELCSLNSGHVVDRAIFGYRREMLTVVIETLNDEEPLARTLASLVGASVDGVVREVIVLDRGSADQTALVAEHAGCRMLAGGDLRASLSSARCEWLLLLEPGARLLEGWTEAVVRHIAADNGPGRLTRSKAARLPISARLFGVGNLLAEGLVIAKAQALETAAQGGALKSLARGVSARRIEAEIVPAARKS